MQAPTPFPLVQQLAFPRENFTPGLERGYGILTTELTARGCEPETRIDEFPRSQADAAAVLLIVTAACVCVAAMRRNRRTLLGAAAALATLWLVAAGALPVWPRHALRSIEVAVEPRFAARNEVILVSHYDSKTELLDHTERFIVFGVAALLLPCAGVAVWRQARGSRVLAGVAGLALGVCALQLISGRFLSSRSAGVVDNAAACAVLVDVASSVCDAPLDRTRVRCLWFAAEELGALASAAYAGAHQPDVPVRVLNLEGIGAGSKLAWAALEFTRSGPRRADADLAQRLQRAAPDLRRIRYPLFTDAGSFLSAGFPALTLLNLPADGALVRGLHGPDDNLEHFDARGAINTRAALLRLLAQLDADVRP